jgi:methyl-accepting chemotaxis protein
MNASWFSVKKEEKDITLTECETDTIKELYNRIEELSLENNSNMQGMSSTIQGMSTTIQGMSSTIQGMSSTIQGMSSTIDELKQKISIIEVANLKLINRILEAEISLERTKNILLRKNISFPFVATPLSNRFL